MLSGKAAGSYLGKVEVARGAQQTDAEQSVKAMLLDRGATANCKPELEIFADDVKCAHGATVGELDAMQLFYAESRGLDPASARALLLEGFVMGLWDSVEATATRSADAARDALRRVVHERADAASTPRSNVRDQFPAIAGLALSRQRRDRAEAAGGDRRDHAGLCARLRDRASRRLRALGGDDRELRGGARRGVER